MWLNWVDIKITETSKQIIIWDLIINNPIFDDVFWKELKRVLDWKKSKEKDLFGDYVIHILWWNFFLIESNNYEEMWKYKKYLEQNFTKTWELSSELIDNNKQNPEKSWYFEYNWKSYIVIQAYNKLTDEIDNKLWIYKWIIINPEKYFGLSWEVNSEIEEKSLKVDEIL